MVRREERSFRCPISSYATNGKHDMEILITSYSYASGTSRSRTLVTYHWPMRTAVVSLHLVHQSETPLTPALSYNSRMCDAFYTGVSDQVCSGKRNTCGGGNFLIASVLIAHLVRVLSGGVPWKGGVTFPIPQFEINKRMHTPGELVIRTRIQSATSTFRRNT